MQTHASLKHSEEGAVSISLNGDEVAIALGRALALNNTHQVGQGWREDKLGVRVCVRACVCVCARACVRIHIFCTALGCGPLL